MTLVRFLYSIGLALSIDIYLDFRRDKKSGAWFYLAAAILLFVGMVGTYL